MFTAPDRTEGVWERTTEKLALRSKGFLLKKNDAKHWVEKRGAESCSRPSGKEKKFKEEVGNSGLEGGKRGEREKRQSNPTATGLTFRDR